MEDMHLKDLAHEHLEMFRNDQDRILELFTDNEELKRLLSVTSEVPNKISKGLKMEQGLKLKQGTPPFIIVTSRYPVALIDKNYSAYRLCFCPISDDAWFDEENNQSNLVMQQLVSFGNGLEPVAFIPVSKKHKFETTKDKENINLSVIEIFLDKFDDVYRETINDRIKKYLVDQRDYLIENINANDIRTISIISKLFLANRLLGWIYPIMRSSLELLGKYPDLNEKENILLFNKKLIERFIYKETTFTHFINLSLEGGYDRLEDMLAEHKEYTI